MFIVPMFIVGALLLNPPPISESNAVLQKRKTQAGRKVFVGTTGWLKTAFHREDNQRNGCIYVMNVQKWLHLLNAEPDQGSCKFHLHEFFEQFPREEEKGRL